MRVRERIHRIRHTLGKSRQSAVRQIGANGDCIGVFCVLDWSTDQ